MPCLSHSCSITSTNAITSNRNNTGATISPCFTLTSKGMDVSIFPMISLTLLLLCILSISEQNFCEQLYFCNILTMRIWFQVSKALTRLANITHVGRLWLFHKYNIVFIVKLPSWHPTPGVDPNWYLTPCSSIILNNLVHKMLLKIFKPRSMSVTPLSLLGSLRFPIFGTSTTQSLCHSEKSTSSF